MDDIVKLFLAVLSVFSPLFGLYLVLLPGIKWRQQAKVRVGTPGLLYDCVIWYPLLILRALVILTMLYAFFLLVVGATAMKAFALHWDLSKFYPQFNYAHLIVILLVTVLLNAAIYFNPTSKLLAWVTHRLDHFRFTHGWANAHWQLTHYKTFFAMSIDKNELERLSNSVVAEIDSNGDASPPDRTPHPLGLDIEELANYLFIGFVMEDRMHQLYPNDRNRLNAAWGYLAHVATLRERPFSPSSILDAGRNGILVHDLLRRLAPAHQQGPALPTDDLIRNAVNNAGTHLAAKYKGRAYRMPFGLFHRGPSVTVLTKRLRKLEEFRGGILHVFIKVSVRMQIWPSMKVGAFRYAYNDSMAALFLNSGVLAAPNDTKEIEVDETFRDLVSGAEDAIVNHCYQMFAQPDPSPKGVEAARRIFGLPSPSNVEIWKYKDYVDLYLWAHSRRYCVKRVHRNGAALGCLVGLSDQGCACDRTGYNWFREGLVLVKREIK